MRSPKRLLCMGMAAALILGGAIAENIGSAVAAQESAASAHANVEYTSETNQSKKKATKAPKATKTPKPTKAPKATKKPKATKTPKATKKPKATKTPKATKKPKATRTPKATKTPKPTRTPKATNQPKTVETPEPTKTPKPTKAPKATETPEPTKAYKPTQAPSAEPTKAPEGKVTITVAKPKGSTRISLSEVSSLTLKWSCDVKCKTYTVQILGPNGSVIHSADQKKSKFTLSLSGLSAGSYTACVYAINGENTVASGKLSFELVSDSSSETQSPDQGKAKSGGSDEEEQQGEGEQGEEGQQGEGQPPGGQKPSGKAGGKSGQGGDSEEEQGFHVTPGVALTSSHTSGNRDMKLYDSVALTVEAGKAMTTLILGGTALDVTLNDGDGAFTAKICGSTLSLIPVSDGSRWALNGYAMRTMARSGIETLQLFTNDGATLLATQPSMTGSVYANLRAAGYASQRYEFTVSADVVEVAVENARYRLSEDGKLIPLEGQ